MTTDNNLPALLKEYEEWKSDKTYGNGLLSADSRRFIHLLEVAQASIALNKKLVEALKYLDRAWMYCDEEAVVDEALELAAKHGVE